MLAGTTGTITRYYKYGNSPNLILFGGINVENGILPTLTAWSQYTWLPCSLDVRQGSWLVHLKVHTGTDVTTSQYLTSSAWTNYGSIEPWIYNGKWRLYLLNIADLQSTTTVLADTDYWVEAAFDGINTYTMSISTDGSNYETILTHSSTTKAYYYYPQRFIIGCDFVNVENGSVGYCQPFLGTIDLKDCYIKQNDIEVWHGTHLEECDATDNWVVSKEFPVYQGIRTYNRGEHYGN